VKAGNKKARPTYAALLTTTTALATALTTGLPIMKLIGVFSEKRLGAGDQT